jgi:hypothetical protein
MSARIAATVVAFLLSFSTVLLASPLDGIRFTGAERVVEMRVEVLSSGGTVVYDSLWKSGNLLDFSLTDSFGQPLGYGSYRVRVSSKSLDGNVDQKDATLRVQSDGVAIDGQSKDSPAITLIAHDGASGALITTRGDLSFRFGDYLNQKESEAMRLSPEGNLEVKGWIRPGQGIAFPDGSVLTSAAGASIMRVRASRPPEESADAKLHPKSDVTGTGTTNQITKWVDTIGTLGDSAISEAGGAVKIGTVAAQGQLQIAGAANQDIFSGMGPNLTGPAFNFGYGGQTFGIGAGFFNARPAAAATGVNPSLRFMTVNLERMIITNAGNVGIGTTAPSQKLDVSGSVNAASLNLSGNLSLPATTSGGTAGVITLGGFPFLHDFPDISNTFVGVNVGNFSMSGQHNTGSGKDALGSNTTGSENTAIGRSALFNNTTGSWNTSTGSGSLFSNTSGYSNSATGESALGDNTTGYQNTAAGYYALSHNSTGINNVAVGEDALFTHTAGNANVAVGLFALRFLNSGDSNIALGSGAGQNLTTGSSNIYIGHAGVSSESNTIRIGASTSTAAYMAGIYGVTQAAGFQVYVDSTGKLGTLSSSSAALKREIADIGDASSPLLRLRPVSFLYRSDPIGFRQYGLIAEEVAKVMPELVSFSDSGKAEAIRYHFLAPLLLNEMQKQQHTIEEQDAQIKNLEERMRKLESAIASRQ